MVFTEQQLQVKKLVDVQQDIEIDALNDGVGALSSTMQNGFTEAANNFSDIQNSLGLMNSLSDERYNGLTGSVNALSNAMTQGFLDIGNTVANVAGEIQGQLNQMNANTGNMNDNIQGQFNDVNNYVGGFENNVNTALQGIQNTFYGMENDYLDRFNQVNANIGDSINNFNEQIRNELSVNVFSADTMIYNVSATPVSSLTALGYDSNGKIIPVTVIANTNIQLPTSANYLYTDSAGTPYAGMADTAVSTNENLVTSHAVYNAVNDIWTDLNEFHNEVSNAFGGVQNSFNAVDSTFAGVQNQFNDVNNAHNTLYQNVVDGFIDVWANFDSVNNNISNMNNNIQNQFNGVQNQFNGVNNSIEESNTLLSLLLGFHSGDIMNLYPTTYYNSTSAGYQNLTGVVFAKNTDVVGTSYGNTVLNFNTQTNILTIGTPFGLPFAGFNKNMKDAFYNCNFLNQNIQIPEGVTDMSGTFAYCRKLNQNIKIPNTVTKLGFSSSAAGAFASCNTLNQSIVIPENVTMMPRAFFGCSNLNQDIYIYSDKLDAAGVGLSVSFQGCTLLASRNIHIRKTISMDASNAIYNCLVNNKTGINWTGRIYNDL
jgi:hypothetical protein